jgi:meiotically up-regulated gene 157 (Mug157) protein
VTYDNALVWRALLDLARIYQWEKNPGKAKALQAQAARVKAAILRHCVVKGSGGEQFAWSVDLDGNGKPQFYDEPPGSLLLLPHYGFCKTTDPVWKNTRDWIYSPDYPYSFAGKPFEEVGCAHAPHPWVLGAVNSLLAGESKRALKFLKDAKMDNGIACESVDENTGGSASGDAFATCAGFLSYGLWHELGKKTIPTGH